MKNVFILFVALSFLFIGCSSGPIGQANNVATSSLNTTEGIDFSGYCYDSDKNQVIDCSLLETIIISKNPVCLEDSSICGVNNVVYVCKDSAYVPKIYCAKSCINGKCLDHSFVADSQASSVSSVIVSNHEQSVCDDFDGGINYTIGAKTTLKTPEQTFIFQDEESFIDLCVNDTLKEYFCDRGSYGGFVIKETTSKCLTGCDSNQKQCVSGVCKDSDGLDYNLKGTVTLKGVSGTTIYNDGCNNNFSRDELTEYTCESGRVKSITYTCPGGCLDGACVPCLDTDGGYNLKVKGDVWVLGMSYKKTSDYCVTAIPTLLREKGCTKEGRVTEAESYCGTICKDGACQEATCTDENGVVTVKYGSIEPVTYTDECVYDGTENGVNVSNKIDYYCKESKSDGLTPILGKTNIKNGC